MYINIFGNAWSLPFFTAKLAEEDYLMIHWVIWHITNACNLNCSYCFTGSSPQSEKGLSPSQNIRIVNEINRSKADLITIIGGEPFFLDDLPLIIEKLLEVPHRNIHVDTNATLIRSRWSNIFRQLHRINIGIDSFEGEIHNLQRGAYSEVVKSILFLTRQKIAIGVNITVTNKNYHNLLQTARFLLQFGVQVIGFGKIKSIGRGISSDLFLTPKQEEIAVDQIIHLYQEIGRDVQIQTSGFYSQKLFERGPMSNLPFCRCAEDKVTIDYNGNVYPCEIMPFVDREVFSKFGQVLNILNTPLDEILKSPFMQKWKEIVYTQPNECQKCRFRLYCNGGCRALNYFLTQQINQKDPRCRIETGKL